MDDSPLLTPKAILSNQTKEGTLYRDLGDGRIECFSCGHRCAIGDGKDGICKVRFNSGGKLFVPWGYVSGLQVDPIEKKPFFHALPGNQAMSFGMLGCDYQCGYCQNWITSQTLRDKNASINFDLITPEDIVLLAHQHKAKIVTSTYNEPLITSEWAVDVFKIAKRYGLVTSYVSNGNATPEVLEFLRPWVDLYKVDLKGFNDKYYRKLGGVLQTVLDSIKLIYEKKLWLEVVTLIVPGFNDSEDELKEIANFLASISKDIPWHVTAFHSDYKMLATPSTQLTSLIRATEIGYEAGLHYVYAGNIPGRVGSYENTYCPSCQELLIARWGYKIQKNTMKNGCCPKCKTAIAGVWKMPDLVKN